MQKLNSDAQKTCNQSIPYHFNACKIILHNIFYKSVHYVVETDISNAIFINKRQSTDTKSNTLWVNNVKGIIGLKMQTEFDEYYISLLRIEKSFYLWIFVLGLCITSSQLSIEGGKKIVDLTLLWTSLLIFYSFTLAVHVFWFRGEVD